MATIAMMIAMQPPKIPANLLLLILPPFDNEDYSSDSLNFLRCLLYDSKTRGGEKGCISSG